MIPLHELGHAVRGLQTDTGGLPAFALADDPDRQAQYPVGWDPAAGNLLIYGVVGSGTSTALAALALAVAAHEPPDRRHLYVLDHGSGDLAALEQLPHTGAYIGPADRARQIRLIRMLRSELAARKAGGGGGGAAPGRTPTARTPTPPRPACWSSSTTSAPCVPTWRRTSPVWASWTTWNASTPTAPPSACTSPPPATAPEPSPEPGAR
ncbi:FtsK/SpoIIIE domain-containing protein [Catenulispora yoronensis]